jgi:hypothetical protein
LGTHAASKRLQTYRLLVMVFMKPGKFIRFHERRLHRQLTNAELEAVASAQASTSSKREKVKAMREALAAALSPVFLGLRPFKQAARSVRRTEPPLEQMPAPIPLGWGEDPPPNVAQESDESPV